MKINTGYAFIILGLSSLLIGILLGVLGAFQFISPETFSIIQFHKTRPLHVSLAIAWLFSAAIGSIYYHLKYSEKKLHSDLLSNIHFSFFFITGVAILFSYCTGNFGGREYWEFPPYFALPILIGWLFFGYNYFKSVGFFKLSWPIYYWQWATGIIFFFISYTESNLWLIPYFRENIVRDLSIQWKANGSLVGSWNMLIYGTAMFLMEKISGSSKTSYSKLSFGLYFLGLINLMFNWAHHTYPVPNASWIRNVAYLISMSELLILGKIIYSWKSSLDVAVKNLHVIPFRFLFAADIWIFVNLTLAIAMSVPVINQYTHGTHITVAHAMGSTIGINTMILLASVFYILEEQAEHFQSKFKKINLGLLITNYALAVFFICLVTAGIIKGINSVHEVSDFQTMMLKIRPFIIGFSVAGLAITIGVFMIIVPALKLLLERKK